MIFWLAALIFKLLILFCFVAVFGWIFKVVWAIGFGIIRVILTIILGVVCFYLIWIFGGFLIGFLII